MTSTLVSATAPLAPLVADWDSDALLDDVLPRLPRDPERDVPGNAHHEYRQETIENYESEYDSRFFEAYLRSRDDLSHDFLAFLDAWSEDEVRHSRGFARIYAALFDKDFEALWSALPERAADSDFSGVDHLFEDEFHILVLFAFDELCTTRAYCQERDQYFEQYGGGLLWDWISNVARDEAYHMANCIRLLRRHHAHRLHEVPAVFEKLKALAHQDLPYMGTFVLDQSLYLDDPEYVTGIMDEVTRRLLGKDAPSVVAAA
ncbi:MAG: hypothetical protein ACPGQL_07410 [Thermoplasmatota archaeon]